MLTDSAIHFTLLSKAESSIDSNDVFVPADTFNDLEEMIDLDGNIFDQLADDDGDPMVNESMPDEYTPNSIADVLWGKLKANFAADSLDENTVEDLHQLYMDMSSDGTEEMKAPVIDKVHEKLSDLKVLMDQKRTAKLWTLCSWTLCQL